MISILIFTICSILVAFISFSSLLKKGKLAQLKKTNDKGERWASQRKPIIGGIGFYILFIFSVLYYLLFESKQGTEDNSFWILLLTCSLGFFSGLWDDLKGSTPRMKLLIQLLIGVIIIISGNGVTAFDSNWMNYPITIFWVVSLMNSINMLDNMDAITTSVSTVIIASLLGISLYFDNTITLYTFSSIGILISLILFLKWNWNPSKMYMGDNGSQFLGAFLAFIGIKVIWNNNFAHISDFPIKEIVAILMSFIAMISDTATVTINRLRAGKSPFIGGRDHTTHHLSYLGLTERQVALTFIVISILANICAFFIIFDTHFTVLKSILWLLVAGSIFACLYTTTIIAKPKK